jgi:hypothetical protein
VAVDVDNCIVGHWLSLFHSLGRHARYWIARLRRR